MPRSSPKRFYGICLTSLLRENRLQVFAARNEITKTITANMKKNAFLVAYAAIKALKTLTSWSSRKYAAIRNSKLKPA